MIMETIKFSIIVPAYKKKFFKECIDSILSQSYHNFELILLNDDSPYDLDSIINTYDDDRIKYFHNQPKFGAYNVIGNWNKGLSLSSGDFVLCMGDDDMLSPTCLYDYYEAIKKFPNYDLYHTMTEIINENSEIVNLQEARPLWESAYSIIWHLWNGRRQFIGDWLFRKKALNSKNGFFFLPYAWGADHITAINVAEKRGVINLHDFGFKYRENRYNLTKKTDNTKDKLQAMLEAKIWYEKFFKRTPENSFDKIYYKLLLANLDKHFNKRFAFDISERLKSKPLSIFYWFFFIKKHKMNFKILYLSIAIALKNIFIK